MSYLVVPLRVTKDRTRVWLGAINESVDPSRVRLRSQLGDHPLDPSWENWQSEDGDYRLNFQRVDIGGLQPSRRYSFKLRVSGVLESTADVTSLPPRLPTLNERPFIVFLGSCFNQRSDPEGHAGKAFSSIPSQEKPDIKILSGDQVYLDSPWYRFLMYRHRRRKLERLFFEKYMRTWGQSHHTMGFRRILESGANYFTADDHEFWNNAPNAASFIQNTWTQAGRDTWWEIASALYESFQTESSTYTFSVGRLSFFIADTRVNRTRDRTQFMRPEDLQALRQWIDDLSGPGVLVVGQPPCTEKAGFLGRFGDWKLPDFNQYPDLAKAILSSDQSVVILTGDVHFCRIAHGRLASRARLVEVISSPMSLVDPMAEGDWEPAPDKFTAEELPGVVRVPLQTETDPSTNENHFQTIEFYRNGQKVWMRVKLWKIKDSNTALSRVICEKPLN